MKRIVYLLIALLSSPSILATGTSPTCIAADINSFGGPVSGSKIEIPSDANFRISSLTLLLQPASNLKIGVSPEGAYFLNGLIDEVRVTARAVYTANFTTQHKLTGVVDTKGLWRFDRQNARDCADTHTGTLVGGASFSTTVP